MGWNDHIDDKPDTRLGLINGREWYRCGYDYETCDCDRMWCRNCVSVPRYFTCDTGNGQLTGTIVERITDWDGAFAAMVTAARLQRKEGGK